MEGFHLPQRQISLQKQPPQVFWKKRCSQQIRKIHWKTPEQSLFFHKVAGFSLWKQRLWHRWFYVNFVTFVRTIFLQNTSERLLLSFWEHRTFHSKVPFSLSFIILKKSYSESNLEKRCSMLFMFSSLYFKLWKINTLHFLEKI